MIQPRTQTAKRWFQISEAASNKNVIEIYTSKPLGVTTFCGGFDMDETFTYDDVEYINPFYGQRYTNMESLGRVFPYIAVNYTTSKSKNGSTIYLEDKTTEEDGEIVPLYIDAVTKEETTAEYAYKPLQRVDGQENTGEYKMAIPNTPITGYYENAEPQKHTSTTYLWLDNMVQDGDAVVKLSTKRDTGKETSRGFVNQTADTNCFVFVDPDIATTNSTYINVFLDSIYADIMQMIQKGRTLKDALNALPWYLRGSRVNADSTTDTVTNCTILANNGQITAFLNITDLFRLDENGQPNSTLLNALVAKCNEMAQACVAEIKKSVIDDNNLDNVVVDENVAPFSRNTDNTDSSSEDYNPDTDGPVVDVVDETFTVSPANAGDGFAYQFDNGEIVVVDAEHVNTPVAIPEGVTIITVYEMKPINNELVMDIGSKQTIDLNTAQPETDGGSGASQETGGDTDPTENPDSDTPVDQETGGDTDPNP